ncbi:hypothetical protein Q3G72_030358 [Acer saccharum]|nr:hypothetical protein Q3G72_030358 [Acer saccharum]
MAENQDREENQNVTENVNVPEAENQPENVNVAENVAKVDNLAVRVLDDQCELAGFKKVCFGHYLDLLGHMRPLFQVQYIYNLLLRQIRFPGASEDEMWFALGKNKVRLGKREFCLCTRLKFGVLPDIFLRDYVPVPDGIHIQYFSGEGGLLLENVMYTFLSGSFKREGDALKMALMLFANNILFGQDYSRQVTY